MRKGSITAFLCMVLLVMLALLFAGLQSVHRAAGRAVLASGMEQSLYSEFAQYDKKLFEKYGLLFIDAGYGSGELRMGRLLKDISKNTEYIISPNTGGKFGGSDVLQMRTGRAAVTGYVLATDENGTAFRRQVCEIMSERMGVAAVNALLSRTERQVRTKEDLLRRRNSVSSAQAEQAYRSRRSEAAGEDISADPAGELLDYTEKLRKKGILKLVVPKDRRLSGYSLAGKSLCSSRNNNSGYGLDADGYSGIAERLLLQEYLLAYFPCFTDADETAGLQYQAEYAIAGKGTDPENLKAVCNKLLLIREGSNLLFLMQDPGKKAETDSLGLMLGTILGDPGLAEPLSMLIRLAWAYGEGISDMRLLLSGGKVPLLKDASSWKTGLKDLLHIGDPPKAETAGSGLDYEEYLRLLLMARGAQSLTDSLMDLVELNMRQTEGRANFRLDLCIDSLAAELEADAGGTVLTIGRQYGYAEK